MRSRGPTRDNQSYHLTGYLIIRSHKLKRRVVQFISKLDLSTWPIDRRALQFNSHTDLHKNDHVTLRFPSIVFPLWVWNDVLW
jgi:hypothetical protein